MEKDIVLKYVEIEHTNPSMGPYEKIVTITLYNKDPHTNHFRELLEKTKINGLVSLKQYIQFHIDKNTDEIRKVRQAYKPESLNEGETISNLKFKLDSGGMVELSDLRYFRLSGYYRKDFLPVLVKHGSRYEQSDEDDLDLIERRPKTPKKGKPLEVIETDDKKSK